MLKAGKAIELLKSLGKLGGVTGRELFAQLIDRFFSGTEQLQVAKTQHPGSKRDVFIHADPLILSLFSDELPPELQTPSPPPQTSPSSLYTDIFSRITTLPLLPSASISKIVREILSDRCSQVSLCFLNTLRVDYHLDVHMDTLRKVLLMEAGQPMSVFSEEMYKSAYAREPIRSMTPFLRECLTPHTTLTNHLRMEVTRTTSNSSKTPELDAFQSVCVTYTPPFPIGLVLDTELMEEILLRYGGVLSADTRV
eukprot:sb/3468671/